MRLCVRYRCECLIVYVNMLLLWWNHYAPTDPKILHIHSSVQQFTCTCPYLVCVGVHCARVCKCARDRPVYRRTHVIFHVHTSYFMPTQSTLYQHMCYFMPTQSIPWAHGLLHVLHVLFHAHTIYFMSYVMPTRSIPCPHVLFHVHTVYSMPTQCTSCPYTCAISCPHGLLHVHTHAISCPHMSYFMPTQCTPCPHSTLHVLHVLFHAHTMYR